MSEKTCFKDQNANLLFNLLKGPVLNPTTTTAYTTITNGETTTSMKQNNSSCIKKIFMLNFFKVKDIYF